MSFGDFRDMSVRQLAFRLLINSNKDIIKELNSLIKSIEAR